MTAANSAPGHGPKLTAIDGSQTGSPGQRLARARSQRNLSVEDIAKQLNLSARMVKALESDNHKALPGRAFVKGYLRNYAKLVGLSPDELVQVFESQFASADEDPEPQRSARPARWIAPIVKALVLLLIAGVLVVLASIVYHNIGFVAEKAHSLSAPILHEVGDDLPSVASEYDNEGSGVQTDDGGLTAPVKVPIQLAPVQQEPADSGASSVSTDTPSAPADGKAEGSSYTPVTPQSSLSLDIQRPLVGQAVSGQTKVEKTADDSASAQQDSNFQAFPSRVTNDGYNEASVTLNFSRESWVRVKDAKGSVIFDGVRQAGAAVQLQGQPPIDVKVGYAPGVKVMFNGEPYEFNVSNRSNVAQFTLGGE